MYALHDSDNELKKQGMFLCNGEKHAHDLNKQGYGIHQAVNEFNGQRKAENLTKIKFWIADIDDGNKIDMIKKIRGLEAKPSVVVETKRGYHLYWIAIDGTEENYRTIQAGIAKKLNADQACKDVARALRMPGFYHMKDPNNPFLVKIVKQWDLVWTEKEMLYAYPMPKPKYKKYDYVPKESDKQEMLNPDNWDKIFRLNNIAPGCRHHELVRITLWLFDLGFDGQTISETVHEMNRRISEPLSEYEVNSILKGKV